MANAGMKGRPIVPLMLSALDVGIRSVFYLAIIPGPLAFLLVARTYLKITDRD